MNVSQAANFLVIPLLNERRFTSTCVKISQLLSKLFFFEYCSVLFYDPINHELFKIQADADWIKDYVNDPDEFLSIERNMLKNVTKYVPD